LRAPLRRGSLGEIRDLLEVYRGGSLSSRDLEAVRPRVAVVLGAQVLRDGRPSRTLEARTRHAGGLYARGEVDLLIPTGGEGEHPPGEAEVMAGILRGMGVPEEAILREDRARSTWESALLVAEIARGRELGAVLVVTDPLHCVRTVAAFRRAGLRAVAEPVYSSPMWREKWLRRGQLFRESGALVWYRIRHGVAAHSRP
jgi:vancomycin permeability regulator SanA